MKEPTEQKIRTDHIFVRRQKILVIAILVLALSIAIIMAAIYQTEKKKSADTNQGLDTNSEISVVEEKDNPDEPDSNSIENKEPVSADDFYQRGQIAMADKNWQEAASKFEMAIALDNENPDYFNRKSQAEYNMSQKDRAISTINEGLVANPGSDFLKSRLDILQKEFVGSQPQ